MSFIANKLLWFDSFATPVASINLNGNDKIATVPGACFTIITQSFLLYLAVLSFLQMTNYDNNKIQSYSV